MYKNIKYFKGLSTLRFFAAYFVVLHHAEEIRKKYELVHLKDYSLFRNGSLAVTFFFVLSGFLITYLLLKEQKRTNTIAINKFYIRRVLRIWPLYFLLVFLGTIVIPFALYSIGHDYEMPYTFSEVIFYFIFFMPFVVNVNFGHHLLEPLWSIGVEELFYLGWAPLFKFLNKHLLVLAIAVILIKMLLSYLISQGIIDGKFAAIIKMLQFEAMAIGAIGAFWLYHKSEDIATHFLFSGWMQMVFFAYLIGRFVIYNYLLALNPAFAIIYTTPFISKLLLLFSFLWLILNTSTNSQALINLESKLFDYLGDISYGIYMYHMLVLFSLILIGSKFLSSLGLITGTLLFYFLLTSGVLIVAGLSKKYFENPFLKLKERY